MKELIFRKDKIIELCKGQEVLHLGFIQHSNLYKRLIEEDRWLHEKLNKVASKLIGFDYLESDVLTLSKIFGYEAYYCDVTKLDKLKYDYEFDVIVCGELIEHLA